MKKIILFINIFIAISFFNIYSNINDFYDQYNIAYELFLDNNYKLSNRLLKVFLISHPDEEISKNALFLFAETQYFSQQYKLSLNSYLDLIKTHPEIRIKYKKEIYYRIAECYFYLKDYDSSIKYIDLLLNEFSKNYLTKDAYLLLAENEFLKSNYDKALDALNKLETFKEYKNFDYVYYLKGRIFYEKALTQDKDIKNKYLNESARYFNKIEKEFPDSTLLNYSEFRKSNVFYALKEYDKSIDVLKKLLKKDLKDKKLEVLIKYFLAWDYYMVKDYKEAILTYNDIIKNYDDSIFKIWAEYKKGLCFEALGEKEKAISQYKKVIENYSGTIPAAYSTYAIAYFYYNEKDFYKALSVYKKIISNYENIEELLRGAFFMEGDIYMKLKKFSKAREIYNIIQKKFPLDTIICEYLKGWCFYNEGDYQKSIEIYKNIINNSKIDKKTRIKSLIKIGDNYYSLSMLKKAEEYYNEALKFCNIYKDLCAEALYAKGWIYYKMNDFIKSIDTFKNAGKIAQNKNLKTRAKFMIANTYYSNYEFLKALKIYNEILNEPFTDTTIRLQSLFYKGWCYYRKEDFDTAIKIWNDYKNIVKDRLKRAEAIYRIGWAYFRKNDYDLAISNFSEILNNYKDIHFYQDALLKIGDSYYNKREYKKAIEYYKQLVEKFPKHSKIADALYGIQWSYYQLGQYDKAVEISKEFIKKYPESNFAPEIQYRIAEHYYNIKKYKIAINEFLKFIEKYSDDDLIDNAYYWVGVSYLKIRDYNKSISFLKELIRKYPETKFKDKSLFKIGTAYYKLHEYKEAIEYYKKIVNLYKGFPYMDKVYFNIAMAYKRLNDIDKSIMWYKKLIEEFKTSKIRERALINLGYIYQDNKKYEEAIKYFKKVIKLKGDKSVEAQFWIGDCRYSQKKYDLAIKEYYKVYKNYKDKELWALSALDKIGKIYEKKGDLLSAIKTYKKILKVTKNKKYTSVVKKKIKLLREEYKLLNSVKEDEGNKK